MTKNEVRQQLRLRLRQGYRPRRDWESAEDHNTNWMLLSPSEFDAIVAEYRGRSLAIAA